MSKIITFSKHFILGANKDAGLKDRKNSNKIKKAVENTSGDVIQGFLKEEDNDVVRVLLPITNEEVVITKRAIQPVKETIINNK